MDRSRKQARGPAGVYAWAYTGALALVLLLVTAFAAANAKSPPRLGGAEGAAPAPQARKPEAEPAALRPTLPPKGARFFTINELLAKRDRDSAGAGGRTAAVDAGTATDAAPGKRALLGPEPFGLFAFRAPDGLLWTKWRGLESDLAAEAQALSACRDAKICDEAAARFLAIVDEAKAREGRARLETANRLVNGAIRYVNDREQHGISDRWQAPLAALGAGRGDCEEYAIAKYHVLRAAGVAADDMRLILVRDTAIRIDHAVLAVRFEERWLVLDNRRQATAETEELRHYQPLYALDREGVKLYAAPYAHWGMGGAEFADWQLRGADGAEFAAEWSLRGSDAEPAANY